MEHGIQRIKQDRLVTTLDIEVSGGWDLWLLLTSDVHWDSSYSRRDVLKKHLAEVKDRNGLIWCSGDFFDGMQGKWDRRRSYSELRPEYKTDNYYDAIVEDAVESFRPYSQNFLGLALGNHETGCIRNAGTNILDHFVRDLNHRTGSEILYAPYHGWIRFMFRQNNVPQGSISMKYHHGYGSSDSPVTKGVIQSNRQAVYLPDAHIVHNGHNHESYIVPIVRERLNNKGIVGQDIQWHVRTPGYKSDFINAEAGFGVEKNPRPKPLGSVWLHLAWKDSHPTITPTPLIE